MHRTANSHAEAMATGRGSDPPVAEWVVDKSACVLRLCGDWRNPRGQILLPAVPAGSCTRVRIDARALIAWDTALAARLWHQLAALRRQGAELELGGLPQGLQDVLDLALPRAATAPDAGAAAPARAASKRSEAAITITFFGDTLIALARLLRGRTSMRLGDVLRHVDETGPRSLPIVLLTCSLIGLMLAYMGGAQLNRIGAQNSLADVVTVGMVRELAGMMTGIILAGRLGAAFAAQIATMQANEEIDALRVLGIDPVGYLVMPRLIALLVVASPLIAFGAAAGIAAGLPAAWFAYGVDPAVYLHKCVASLTMAHVAIGLFKGMLYVALVALAGCREGLHAGRTAQAVGAAATAAVVKSLVWIVIAATATTIVFTSLGY